MPGAGPGPLHRRATTASLLAAVLAALTAVECLRQGGFWRADALVVGAASVVVLTLALWQLRPPIPALLAIAGVVTLAAWWLLRAVTVGDPASFLPLGASMLGFGAGLAVVQPLTGPHRDVAARFVAALGAAAALVGFAGLAWRWFPMAMPAQGLWRLSTTLTYSDAAGLLLAICLLVALGCRPDDRVARLSVCLCSGGLIASQSRGALVAFVVAFALVPLRQYRVFGVPLAAGVALGMAAVATSPSAAPVHLLVPVVLVVMAVSVIVGRRRTTTPAPVRAPLLPWVRRPQRAVLVAVLVLLVVGAGVGLLHHELALRALAPSDQDRQVEWSAAFRQFLSSPLVGVGPDQLLHFVAPDGTFAHFAHNEYLQIAADSGVVGLALLAAVAVAVGRLVRRVDVQSSAATASLVCWAAGGLFDFNWHLSALGLLGGWVAGMAARRD